MNDYSKLETLAKAATPGPWEADNSRHEGSINAADRHIGMVSMYAEKREDIPQNFANQEFIAAANPAVVLELIAENKGQAKKIRWDESWYGARFETLFHWAHRELNEEQKTQYFNIVANGSSSPLDPPTYAQQMNSLKWKVEAAEKERDMLKAELEALRQDAERYRWLRTQCIPLQGHDFLSSHEILDRRVDAKILKESGEAE